MVYKKTIKSWFIYRKKTAVLCLAVFFFLLAAYFILKPILKSEAETAYLYPSICLGNFQNPDKAQGQPELSDSASADKFNNENSAFYEGGTRQLLCGGFDGEKKDDINIKKVSLQLIWAENIEETIEDSETPINNEVPLEVEEKDEKKEVSVFLRPFLSSFALASEEEAVPIIENPSPVQLTEASNSETPIIEEINSINPENANTEIINTFIDDGLNVELPEEEDALLTEDAASSDSSTTTLNSEPDNSENYFIIRYSFNETDWQTLTEVKKIDFSKFELALSGSEDLSQLRFSIESAGLNKPVYLDGMVLAIEYEKKGEETKPNFENNEIISLKSNDNYSVMLLRDKKSEEYALWLYNREDGISWKRIDTSDSIKTDGPLALKDNYVFWLTGDGMAIIGFNINATNYFSQSIDPQDESGLVFDFDYLEIKYKNNELKLEDKISSEEKSLDDSLALNKEIEANFQFQEPIVSERTGEVADEATDKQTPHVFDVKTTDESTIITIIDLNSEIDFNDLGNILSEEKKIETDINNTDEPAVPNLQDTPSEVLDIIAE